MKTMRKISVVVLMFYYTTGVIVFRKFSLSENLC